MLEIEIKSLLGKKPSADKLLNKLLSLSPTPQSTEQSQQLNHYFAGEDKLAINLQQTIKPYLSAGDMEKLTTVINKGHKFSVRTREINQEQVRLVVKASVDETTSENGISRHEFEENVIGLTLEELDQLLLGIGYTYQAKWSRERKAYSLKYDDQPMVVSIDKNAGYGYLAEFEATLDDDSIVDQTQKKLRKLMRELGAEELAQDRLERMFAFYNQNWQDYYGTDKTFLIP